jgi:hypothetical protein
MEQPMMGKRQRRMRTGPFILILSESQAPPRVAIICTAPKGMLKRIVVKRSKPKDSMIRGPNVEMPPLGILT